MGDACKHGQTMFCTDCFTEATTPSAVPATTDRIVDLLEAHYRKGDACKCGEPTDRKYGLGAYNHRVHVAALLALLVADALEQVAAQITVEAQAANGHVHERYFSALMDAASYVMKRATELRDSGEGEKLQQQPNASEGEEHAGSDKVVGTHTPHNTPERNENS